MTRQRRGALLADIGGTNARLTIASDGALGDVTVFRVADFPTFDDVISVVRNRETDLHLSEVVLAVAGPVDNGRVALTNSPWVLDASDLRQRYNCERVLLVNDFEAMARGVSFLQSGDLHPVGGGKPDFQKPQVVLGPGTGFGMACRVPTSSDVLVLATEGGHASVAAVDAREDAIVAILRSRFGHVSIERVLSGRGIENLYAAIAMLERQDAPALSAEHITTAALQGTSPLAEATLDLFFGFLGGVAGNAALSFGARGGVYIAGGIVPRLVSMVSASRLRERFEAKGRFRDCLKAVPLNIIVNPQCALLGLMSLTSEHSGSRGGNGHTSFTSSGS